MMKTTLRGVMLTGLAILSMSVTDARAQSAPSCTAAHRCVAKLMSNAGQVREIAATSRFVCWSDASSITCQPKPIGPEIRLVTGETVSHFAVDTTNVYWSTGASLRARPLLGGPITTLCANYATDFVVSAHAVYWSDRQDPDRSVRSCPIQGGPVTTVETTTSFDLALAAGGLWVVWLTDDGSIHRQWGGSVNAQPPVLVTAPPSNSSFRTVRSIATDGQDAYVLLYHGEVVRMPLAGGPWTTLARGAAYHVSAMQSDQHSLYWMDRPDVISKVNMGGGVVTEIRAPKATTFAVDSTSLYYATLDGSIFEVRPN